MRQATAKARGAKKRTAKALAVKDRKEKRAKGAAGRPGPGRGEKNALPTRKDVLEKPTLAELGLTEKESKEAQDFAKLPKPLKQAGISNEMTETQAKWEVKEQAREQKRAENAKLVEATAVKGNPITVSFQGEPVGSAWDFSDDLIRGWAKLVAAQFPRKAGRPRKYNREQVRKVLAESKTESEAARRLGIPYNVMRALASELRCEAEAAKAPCKQLQLDHPPR